MLTFDQSESESVAFCAWACAYAAGYAGAAWHTCGKSKVVCATDIRIIKYYVYTLGIKDCTCPKNYQALNCVSIGAAKTCHFRQLEVCDLPHWNNMNEPFNAFLIIAFNWIFRGCGVRLEASGLRLEASRAGLFVTEINQVCPDASLLYVHVFSSYMCVYFHCLN